MVFTKIAVIDTGIDSLHPELRPNLWKNTGEFIGFPPSPTPDFLDNDGNGYVDDIWGWDAVGENGSQPDGDPSPGYTHLYQTCSWTESRHAHGTRVAGSLMSVDNNFYDIIDKNIVGVIWHGSIMNVKCVSDYGASNTNTYAAGIQYAAQAGADILSMSWGFIGAIGTLGTAVNYADALGVVMVAAVSYDPSAEGYPAGDIRTISVGGIGASGAVAFPHILFDTSAVVAPGHAILTTEVPDYNCFPSTHATHSGTSMATPMVAGIAGMAMGRRWALTGVRPTAHEIRQVMWRAIDDQTHSTDPPGFDQEFGRGRVNFEKAIYAVSRGDANNTGSINISDAVYIVDYVFGGGGAPLPRMGVGDCNCDGLVNSSDAVYIINFIFNSGPPPLICFQYSY